MSKSLAVARTRKIPQWKIEQVKLIKSLAEKYPTVGLAEIAYVSAPVLHEIRARLRARGDVLKVVKNRLAERALKQVNKKNIANLAEYLKGSNAMIFTTLDPFKLKKFLDENKVAREARAGDIAQKDIIIPEGNTNLAPGPILSLFGKLKIPYRIQEGSIWVIKDTCVAKKGDVISQDLADLLKQLGIKPIEVGLQLKAVYHDGIVFKAEDLELNIEEYRNNIITAVTQALNLAINAAYPTPETAEYLIARAVNESRSLLYTVVLPLKDSLEYNIALAHARAQALYNLVKDKVESS